MAKLQRIRLLDSRVRILQSANALSFDDIQGQTYLQVKGTGRANTCPTLDEGSAEGSALKQGTYALSQFCMEPTKFTVKEESQFKGGATEFVNTKLMTRLTYTLDQVRSRDRFPKVTRDCPVALPYHFCISKLAVDKKRRGVACASRRPMFESAHLIFVALRHVAYLVARVSSWYIVCLTLCKWILGMALCGRNKRAVLLFRCPAP